MTASSPPLSRIMWVYLALLALLSLTVAASQLPPGPWSTPISLLIATAKMVLIFTYFMRLREQPALVRAFALAGFFWLAIMLGLTFTDVLTRG